MTDILYALPAANNALALYDRPDAKLGQERGFVCMVFDGDTVGETYQAHPRGKVWRVMRMGKSNV